MRYSDLLGTPYKEGGRTKEEGFDCYGLVLECCKRSGTPLMDFSAVYTKENITVQDLETFARGANVRRTNTIKEGSIVECEYNGQGHLGFAVDRNNILHTTKSGVRCTYKDAVKIKAAYEVLK